jgi:hypothetical protein
MLLFANTKCHGGNTLELGFIFKGGFDSQFETLMITMNFPALIETHNFALFIDSFSFCHLE